jgi:hypothetical protein
LLEVGGV